MKPRSTPLPAARLVREDGVKTATAFGRNSEQVHPLRPIWNGLRYAFGMAGAFAPLVAVVALAIMLLWSAAMAGSP